MASVREWVKHRKAKILLAQLSSADPGARTAAADSLCALGDCALPDLFSALENGDAHVRATAAQVLGKSRSSIVVAPLLGRLTDPDSNVRVAVARALTEIGGSAITPLIGCLSDHNPDVRRGAVTILGEIADLRATTHLIACLKDDCVTVRQAAVEALGSIRDPRAVPALTALLRDWSPSVAQAALTALNRVGTNESLAALRAWHDEKTAVR
jgi:hypothetical protein